MISPLLANIYLHEVLDRWWVEEVLPRLRGRAFAVRYADDFVLGFAREEDARRVQEVLAKRFARFGLTLHPDKTRLVPFRHPDCRRQRDGGVEPEPGSFDFLGFTHFWAKSRKGRWMPKQKTAKSRFTRALRAIHRWCRASRHRPLAEQAAKLRSKLTGHDRYFGITGNFQALARFHFEVRRVWRYWLSRRSQRAYVSWKKFGRILEHYPLPHPVAYHSVYRRRANP